MQDHNGPIGLSPQQVTNVLALSVDPAFAESLGDFQPPEGCDPEVEDCSPALSAEDMAASPAGAALLESLAQTLAEQLGVDVSMIDISSIGLSMEDDGTVNVETGDNITGGQRRLEASGGAMSGWAFCTANGPRHSCTVDIAR